MTKQDGIKKQYEPVRGPGWIVEFKLPRVRVEFNEKIKDNKKDKDGSH